jgi:hypothetical protein
MNDAHAYEMQVQMWKPNTWGVTCTVNGGALSPHPPMPRERHDGERERTGSFFCNEVGESGVIFSLGWHGVRGGGESGPTTDQNGKKFNLI